MKSEEPLNQPITDFVIYAVARCLMGNRGFHVEEIQYVYVWFMGFMFTSMWVCAALGRLENDIECPLPFSALLSWDSNLEACWFFLLLLFICFWLCSKLSGFSTPLPHSFRVRSHAWLFMWAQDIQTQSLMLRGQLFLPTEPSLQSLVEVLKEASHLHHGP